MLGSWFLSQTLGCRGETLFLFSHWLLPATQAETPVQVEVKVEGLQSRIVLWAPR